MKTVVKKEKTRGFSLTIKGMTHGELLALTNALKMYAPQDVLLSIQYNIDPSVPDDVLELH